MLIRKSSPFVWIILILAIFVLGLTYVILSKPLSIVYNTYVNDSDIVHEQDMQDFYTRSNTVWSWIMFPIAISLILWAIIEIQRKRDES